MPTRTLTSHRYRVPAAGARVPAAGAGSAGVMRGISAADLALRRDLQRHLRRLRAEHRRLLRALYELHRLESSSAELASSLAEPTSLHGLVARRVLPS